MLHGPPGTGKTLLAKAVAHESGAQFFSQSAASFVEMFAGLGAARIRRLFAEAREHRPAIIFIDELDAVGARRGSDQNSEREQTLNQLLVEMDGFDTAGDLVVIAASNLLEKLDPALLRPGRFDRQILVSPPDVGGREAILRVHARNKPLGEDVDLATLARQTSGLAGADLANICNEAAIFAARAHRSELLHTDFDAAVERVVAGMQSRRTLTEHERRVVAWHEAGHALCAELLPGVDRVHKISIVPRGSALGYTLNLPEEDRYLKTREELIDHMTVLLAGRVAEELVFGAVTTGAANDLHRVAEISRAMIHDYAMGTSITSRKISAHGGEVSDRTRELRDEEQQHLADEARRAAARLLSEHREQLDELAGALLRNEVLERARHRPDHGRDAALPARRRRPAGRRRRPGSAAGDERVGVRLRRHPLQPAGADLAVGVVLRAVRHVEREHVPAVVLDAALLGDRVAGEPPGAAGEPDPRAGGDDGDVEDAVGRVGGADARAAAERAGDRHDDLPRLAVEHRGVVRAHRAPQRRRRDGRVDGAGGVGERAEPRLERVGAARRDRGEPGAGDVDERMAVAEAAELVAAQLGPADGELRGRDAVARQAGRARVVVRGAHRDHAERDAEPPRDLGDAGDRAVAARDDDAVDAGDLLAVPERELGDLRAVPLHGGDERPGLEPAPRVPVRDQRNAHARSVPSARISSGTMPDFAIGTRSG